MVAPTSAPSTLISKLNNPDQEIHRLATLVGLLLAGQSGWRLVRNLLLERVSLSEALNRAQRAWPFFLDLASSAVVVGLDQVAISQWAYNYPWALSGLGGAVTAALHQDLVAGGVAAASLLAATTWRPYELPMLAAAVQDEKVEVLQEEFQNQLDAQLTEALVVKEAVKVNDWVQGKAAEQMKEESADFQKNPDDFYLLRDVGIDASVFFEVWSPDPARRQYNPRHDPWPFTDRQSIVNYARKHNYFAYSINYVESSSDFNEYPSFEQRQIKYLNFFDRNGLPLNKPFTKAFPIYTHDEAAIHPSLWAQQQAAGRWTDQTRASLIGSRAEWLEKYPQTSASLASASED